MEKDSMRSKTTGSITAVGCSRESIGANIGISRARSSDLTSQTTSSDFVLQWGNRKRLRCMKIQVRDDLARPVQRTTLRIDRQNVRSDGDASNQPSTAFSAKNTNNNGHFNLRQRPYLPQAPRMLRYSENCIAVRGQSNGGARGFASPDRGVHDMRGIHHKNSYNHTTGNGKDMNNNKSEGPSDRAAQDCKKEGGSSSGSGEVAAVPPVWPPKFVIALTNKEKEEDFLVLKGSKLPQRPKKRAKFIQRTLNVVSPGTWLCDLTLERYEVREKKVTKKRPRGLKAMGNMESDSE